MNSFYRIFFIVGTVVTAALGHIASSHAADCASEAATAAEYFAQNNNNFYGCRALNMDDKAVNGINVTIVCTSETGSHTVVVKVTYTDPSSCSNPSYIQISVD